MYLLDNVSGSTHLHISLSNKWNDNKHLVEFDNFHVATWQLLLTQNYLALQWC